MLECRYHGWCRLEYDNDFGVCCPCIGDGVEACMAYEPMPDVEALTALADELEEDACWEVQTPGNTSVARRLKDTCDRIRKALGVDE